MRDERAPIWRGLAVTLVAAALTAAVGYVFSVLQERRRTELQTVENQIRLLYGPLYALTQSNQAAWASFRSTYRPGTVAYWEGDAPSADQVKAWRLWMSQVFQPMNMKMRDAIIDNTQLIVGEEMPSAFQDLIAHTESYRAVLSSWRPEDRCAHQGCDYLTERANTAPLDYPVSLAACVAKDYARLRELQQDLRAAWVVISVPKMVAAAECEVRMGH